MKDQLEMLRAYGVKRAKFDGGALIEVEFFGADAGPVTDDDTRSSGLPADVEEQFSAHERALAQVRTRRFSAPAAPAGGDA